MALNKPSACLGFALILTLLAATGLLGDPAYAANANDAVIIDEWTGIKVPPPPELKPVTLDAKTSALLILDIQNNSVASRPRCAVSVPKIQKLLENARAKGCFVAYSITSNVTPADIYKDLAPRAEEPVVKTGVDKFFQTDLEKILADQNVKTVIIVGTAAHGAVLHTAVAAALRGMQVIVPVDGMSADDPFAEQYTAWHLVNSPGARNRVTLTKMSLIAF